MRKILISAAMLGLLSSQPALAYYNYAVQELDEAKLQGVIAHSVNADDLLAILMHYPKNSHETKEVWLNFPSGAKNDFEWIETGSRIGGPILNRYPCIDTCTFWESSDTKGYAAGIEKNSVSGPYEYGISEGPATLWNAQLDGVVTEYFPQFAGYTFAENAQVGIEIENYSSPNAFSYNSGTYFDHLTYKSARSSGSQWAPWPTAINRDRPGSLGISSTFFPIGAMGSPNPAESSAQLYSNAGSR